MENHLTVTMKLKVHLSPDQGIPTPSFTPQQKQRQCAFQTTRTRMPIVTVFVITLESIQTPMSSIWINMGMDMGRDKLCHTPYGRENEGNIPTLHARIQVNLTNSQTSYMNTDTRNHVARVPLQKEQNQANCQCWQKSVLPWGCGLVIGRGHK